VGGLFEPYAIDYNIGSRVGWCQEPIPFLLLLFLRGPAAAALHFTVVHNANRQVL
jgi:hypothetical protein